MPRIVDRTVNFIIIVFMGCVALLLVSCEDKEKVQKEKNYYHVWLENTEGQRIYSGKVKGLSSCRYVANHRIRGSKNPNWHFECCLITPADECALKEK